MLKYDKQTKKSFGTQLANLGLLKVCILTKKIMEGSTFFKASFKKYYSLFISIIEISNLVAGLQPYYHFSNGNVS